jgi:glyoxylase-like metal-dependent hydrolase (beta-lactamase superfamily II)
MLHLVYNLDVQLPSATYIWYIEGPKEKIIVDAGSLPTAMGSQPLRFPRGKPSETVQSLEQGLGKLGLKPEDIDTVIVTHLHGDHIHLARKYKKAKFIIQKTELEFARNPHPVQAFHYFKDYFEGLNFEVIEGDKEIVEGVKVILTPGHTPGGQSVAVKTAKGIAIITGFCCINTNFNPPKELGASVIPPGILTDALQAYDSVMKVKHLADFIVPSHDGEFINRSKIP